MLAVVDYGMGNLRSVTKALEMVGADVVVTQDHDEIRDAERIVLPGVGSFAQGMAHLSELGLDAVLTQEVMEKKKPFLGICLGMHLVARSGTEYGECTGLGWIDAHVEKFSFSSSDFKVPHMGWNDIEVVRESPLFSQIKTPASFYFVHSYYFVPHDERVVAATTDHGGVFASAVSMDNIYLVQFHPEKSQDNGVQLLENFMSLESGC